MMGEQRSRPEIAGGQQYPMSARQRARLRQFMLDRFNLRELKDLAFDLGVDHELFEHRTVGDMVREMIAHFERRDALGCLVREVLRHRPDSEIGEILAGLPPCNPLRKLLIVVAEDLLSDARELLDDLAALVGVDPDEVVLIGAARGSTRLLVGVPVVTESWSQPAGAYLNDGGSELVEAPEGPALLEITSLGRYRVNQIVAFDSLDLASRETWRVVAVEWPPIRRGLELRPTIAWGDALEETADVNRLSRLLDYLALERSHLIFTLQDLEELKQSFPDEPLSSLMADKVERLRRAVVQSRDVRQIGLFEFHLGLIYLSYDRFTEAAGHFAQSRSKWQFDKDRTLATLARFAEGIAYHRDFQYDEASSAYMEVGRLVTRISELFRGPSLAPGQADYRSFVADLSGQVEQVQKKLRQEMLFDRRPIIDPELQDRDQTII